MPQAWIPPMEELEKKVVFSPCRGDETTTYYDRAFFFMSLSLLRESSDRHNKPSAIGSGRDCMKRRLGERHSNV